MGAVRTLCEPTIKEGRCISQRCLSVGTQKTIWYISVGSTLRTNGYEVTPFPAKNRPVKFVESILLKFVGALWALGLLVIKPRTTGGTGGLKWQCIANCHLFSISLYFSRRCTLMLYYIIRRPDNYRLLFRR